MRIAVIGGGASGLIAAIAAREKKADVTIFEKNDRVGKKLLMTGNGKCNLSNRDFRTDYYRSTGEQDLRMFFDAFGVEETVAFFEQLGMLVKNKNGYLYPASEQAGTVSDILRFACMRSGVDIKTMAEVKKITKNAETFVVEVREEIASEEKEKAEKGSVRKEKYCFDRVILACGSKAGPKNITSGSGYLLAKSFGHHVTELVPALVQLRCAGDFFKQIAGVRTECELTMCVDGTEKQKERGELQLTDYGISGIPVFQFSRYAAEALKKGKQVQVFLNFLPGFSDDEYTEFIHNRFKRQKDQTAEQFFLGITNKKIIGLFLKQSGLKPEEKIEEANRKKWEKVFILLRRFVVEIKEPNPFENAQVCAGGVCLEEISGQMESKIVSGLYLAGELLDVDGRCGGYNLQWAWTSGYLAGHFAAGKQGKKQIME